MTNQNAFNSTSSSHTSVVAFRVAALSVLVLVLSLAANAAGKTKAAKPCEFSDASFDVATNAHALEDYQNAIAELLKEKKFKDLDCLANEARAGKTRFSGGAWKLRQLYIGLDSPRPGHPTEVEWKAHMKLIENWKDSYPKSVTAPIALAESYVSYGWAARGTGYSDDVSQSGWKLFGQRAAKAKQILNDAAVGGVKCPDWYIAMQLVSRAEGWPLEQARDLFLKAAKFEPGYQYYYRVFAGYLQPKWSGKEGDAARFAEEWADRIGGEAGDLLYYQIAEVIVCACADPEFGHFSWARAQKGFAALEKTYGPSLVSVNAFALMATKNTEWVLADTEFKRIGDQWVKDTWTSEQWFNQMRGLSAQLAPQKSALLGNRREAGDNQRTKEGQEYQKEAEHKLLAYEQKCLKEAGVGEPKFDVLLLVAKDGDIQDMKSDQTPGQFSTCVSRALYVAHANKETPLPAPPRDGYWVMITLDPSVVSASVK
ncbi:MAG TPA: hypothetical protein VMH04_22460 [Candidatus Solibacter sp.]|nr:hypothetical protein [Candidatus Solibacter sp.]